MGSMLNRNRPKRLNIIATIGILVGLWHIFVGISSPNIASLVIGFACLLLVFGLFMLWNWARIFSLCFSAFVFLLYVSLLFATVMKLFQGFSGIALFFYSPLLIFSLIIVETLNREEIKNLYIKKS